MFHPDVLYLQASDSERPTCVHLPYVEAVNFNYPPLMIVHLPLSCRFVESFLTESHLSRIDYLYRSYLCEYRYTSGTLMLIHTSPCEDILASYPPLRVCSIWLSACRFLLLHPCPTRDVECLSSLLNSGTGSMVRPAFILLYCLW